MTVVANVPLETAEALPAETDKLYFAVPVARLVSMTDLPCDIYIRHASIAQTRLYRSFDSDVPLADDQTLSERNVRHLYLRIEDKAKYDEAIRAALAEPRLDQSLRLALTVEQHRDTFETALSFRSAAPLVAASQKMAGEMLQVINCDEFAVTEAISLLNHDQCTFQHSCNVSIYAATLAKRFGLSDRELPLLITGGLLHDLGKRQIPNFILKKPGKLDARERELIRQHPEQGFRELATLGQLQWRQLMMVYQHHEWVSGAGYPVGLVGDEIHLWGRICAVADVFDALTANRSYRESGPAAAALKIMNSELGHFDAELIQLWTEIVT